MSSALKHDKKSDNISVGEFLLKNSFYISIIAGMFFWVSNLYTAFWMRRFFIILSGILAVTYLIIYKRKSLKVFKTNKFIYLVLIVSIINLLLTSSPGAAFLGVPLVHPGILSLSASIFVGLFLAKQINNSLLKNLFIVTVIWAIINFFFWIFVTGAKIRLGFMDSQVIFAAYVFSLGILIGGWLQINRLMPVKYLLPATTFLITCLILSQTRSAILLVICGLIYMFWDKLLQNKKKLLIFLTICTVSIISMSGYFWRLLDSSYFAVSTEYRLNLAQSSLPTSVPDYFIGGGMRSIENNITNNSPKYQLLKQDIKEGIKFESSHNYFVDLLVERGLLVLALYLVLLVTAIKNVDLANQNQKLILTLLLFTSTYLFFNNANLQMDMCFWIFIISLISSNHKHFDNKSV